MKIYVSMTQYLYDSEAYLTTHLTKKGALMQGIGQMTEDLCSGIDEDELAERISDMPHHPDEDLMCYSSEQLERKFSDWLEYCHDFIEHMSYDWYETEVRA
tara:strand:+ start:3223 stop:3525 length:303 start_codon:yes stop_codon:yes gene_type:complete